jgi:hypothetical protein
MDAVIHDFAKRLKYSSELSDEPAWVEFYRRLWPNLLTAVRVDKNSQWQKCGVDRLLLLDNGKQFTVDEKKRERDYGDLLIEEWSVGRRVVIGSRIVYQGEKVGWSLDASKRCDFIAYAVPSAGKCHLLPFELLRLACVENLERWKTILLPDKQGKRRFPAYPKDAENNGYVTRNCAVEWHEIKAGIAQQMLRKFGSAAELPLPELTDNGRQLTFPWQAA